MGADYYESLEECDPASLPGCTPIGIGACTKIRKAIIDKNARIGENCQILNEAGVMDKDCESEGYIIRDGIIVVIKDAVIKAGTVI
jgi:glucose-1-phosphate adenylyltransferase